jgi:hypothetical protein
VATLAREDRIRGTVRDDATACLDHDYPIDERHDQSDAVLNNDHRHLTALGDAREHFTYGARAVWVQVRGRLVKEQHPRTQREDAGDGESLLLTARKRRRRSVLAVREADVAERAMDARPYLGGGDAAVLEAERDIVAGARHDELRLRILQHETGVSVDAELAFLLAASASVEQARESLQKCALPGAGRA